MYDVCLLRTTSVLDQNSGSRAESWIKTAAAALRFCFYYYSCNLDLTSCNLDLTSCNLDLCQFNDCSILDVYQLHIGFYQL